MAPLLGGARGRTRGDNPPRIVQCYGNGREPKTLTFAELTAEASSAQKWLREHSIVEVEYGEMEAYARTLTNEIARRAIEAAEPPKAVPNRPTIPPEEMGQSGFAEEQGQPDVGAEGAEQLPEGMHTGGTIANSLITTWDSTIRVNQYVKPAQELAKRILDDLERGNIGHLEARELAHAERNRLLTVARSQLSPGGRAFSKAIKEEGKALPSLVERYALGVLRQSGQMEKYGLKTLDKASPLFDAAKYEAALRDVGETAEVSREIVRAAERTGKAVTVFARIGKVAGPVGLAISAGFSTYEIITAPDGMKQYTAGREISGFAGGMLASTAGGLVAGWTASLVCGPAAPACALVVSLVVVSGVGYAGSRAGEAAWERIASGEAGDEGVGGSAASRTPGVEGAGGAGN